MSIIKFSLKYLTKKLIKNNLCQQSKYNFPTSYHISSLFRKKDVSEAILMKKKAPHKLTVEESK